MKSSTGESAASAPRPVPGKAGDLRTRVWSALALGPPVLAAVWAGGWVFLAVVAVVSVLSVHEWLTIVGRSENARLDRPQPARLLACAAVLAVILLYALAGPAPAAVACLVLGTAVGAAAGGQDRWIAGLGVPYVGLGVVGLLWLRDAPSAGLGLFLFLMLAVWACDIGAYAAGRSIGGPKLAPRISPKKTWAGLIGGTIAAALVGAAVAMGADARSVVAALLLGGLVAVVSQGGDLFESALKRRYNVKDSSRLIPGHGGLLDRIDGLLVAAPVLALFHATLGAQLAWW